MDKGRNNDENTTISAITATVILVLGFLGLPQLLTLSARVKPVVTVPGAPTSLNATQRLERQSRTTPAEQADAVETAAAAADKDVPDAMSVGAAVPEVPVTQLGTTEPCSGGLFAPGSSAQSEPQKLTGDAADLL